MWILSSDGGNNILQMVERLSKLLFLPQENEINIFTSEDIENTPLVIF